MKSEDKQYLMEIEEQQKKEWNKTTLAHIRNIRAIVKPSPMFPETVRVACEKYFMVCEDDGVKPSVSGLALALKVSRETLLSWVRGQVSVQCADVVREYFNLIEVFDETALKDNKLNAVAGIFLGKNNYNYKDQVEHKIVESDKKPTNKEIEEKYAPIHDVVYEVDMTDNKETPKTATKKGKGA